MPPRKADLLNKIEGFGEFLFGLARKTSDDICRDRHIGHDRTGGGNQITEFTSSGISSHPFEHRITPRLKW